MDDTIPVGPLELQRLAAVEALRIIGTEPSINFSRICELAVELFEVPIATVTFVDAERVWFKGCAGLACGGMARENAFANYTILQDGVFVVQDTQRDTRFSGSPLVTGEPHIRFYAGTPITLERGIHLGSICLVDQRPRPFGPREQARLLDLAGIAVSELRLLLATRAYLKLGLKAAAN